MADVVKQVPLEQPASKETRDELVANVDALLEQYLRTLDAYQQAQQQLTKYLSSGFISLAQANFNSAHTRYGRDYYDERMQATRKCIISEEEEGRISFSVTSPIEESVTPKPEGGAAKDSAEDDVPAPDSGTETKEEENATDVTGEKASSPAPGTKKKRLDDPLRWFGVLVPPALRAAQASFVSAVEEPVAKLPELSKELRRLEIEIGRARKQIKKM